MHLEPLRRLGIIRGIPFFEKGLPGKLKPGLVWDLGRLQSDVSIGFDKL